MRRKRTMFIIIIVIALIISTMLVDGAKKKKKGKRKVKHGPHGMAQGEWTNCEDFSKNARFNPYSVVDQTWFVFFYWAPPMDSMYMTFLVPTSNYSRALKNLFDGNVSVPVNWTAKHILMRDNKNQTSLLVERNDRGLYWLYSFYYNESGFFPPRDVRLKQTSDGKILGYMDCETETVYAMSRLNEVPRQNRLQDEAAKLGHRYKGGKSYLYQGHHWGPVGEEEEDFFWARDPHEVYPEEFSDPKSQQILRDLEKNRGAKLSQSQLRFDPGKHTINALNTLQYEAQEPMSQDHEFSSDRTVNKNTSDLKEPESVSESENSQAVDLLAQEAAKEVPETDSATEPGSYENLPEPEEINILDSPYPTNANTLVASHVNGNLNKNNTTKEQTVQEGKITHSAEIFTNNIPHTDSETSSQTSDACHKQIEVGESKLKVASSPNN